MGLTQWLKPFSFKNSKTPVLSYGVFASQLKIASLGGRCCHREDDKATFLFTRLKVEEQVLETSLLLQTFYFQKFTNSEHFFPPNGKPVSSFLSSKDWYLMI